jgi:DNA polymerase III subunit delta'
MSFADFHGNENVVSRLREMLARNRFPQAVILAGPAGSGKYTLSLMLAKAMNCLPAPVSDGLPDFCGKCFNCTRIAQAEDLSARCAEAIEARENLREADKKDTRILVQTHPDVTIIPPDPPQMMIKVDQVRRVIETIYFRPVDAKERIYIFTAGSFMREAANSLLKVLEEPPDFATVFLLAENPGELLPTIRSRSMLISLACLPDHEVEKYLAKHRPEWKAKDRALVARLSGGAVGHARSFDLSEHLALRGQVLTILSCALRDADHSELFKITETYRAGAEGREKAEKLIRVLYSLLQDFMFVRAGTPELVRNVDIHSDLEKLARSVDFGWISFAAEQVGEIQRGMRRNVLRSLSLDAFAAALER